MVDGCDDEEEEEEEEEEDDGDDASARLILFMRASKVDLQSAWAQASADGRTNVQTIGCMEEASRLRRHGRAGVDLGVG